MRPDHLADLYAKLLKGGLAPRKVKHVHRLLHRALWHAAKPWRIAQQNVAALVEPPKVDSEEIVILSPERIKQLLRHVEGRTLWPILALAPSTGARRGELLALRIRDFDPRGSHHPHRALLGADQGRVAVQVAQDESCAANNLDPALACGRIACPPGEGPRAPPIARHGAGYPQRPAFSQLGWQGSIAALAHSKVCSGHGRPQDRGRHVALSAAYTRLPLNCRRRGRVTISGRLGHGSPAITLTVYGHLMTGTDIKAAKLLETMFAGLRTE